jgi:hypothetical protein
MRLGSSRSPSHAAGITSNKALKERADALKKQSTQARERLAAITPELQTPEIALPLKKRSSDQCQRA